MDTPTQRCVDKVLYANESLKSNKPFDQSEEGHFDPNIN